MENSILKINDKYYILASEGMIDDRTVALKQGNAFSVSDRYGDIKNIGDSHQGIYCNGTRFISQLEMLVNDQTPFMLSSSLNEENEMHIIDLTNPDFKPNETSFIEKGKIQIQRKKFLWENVYYDAVKLCSFATESVTFKISFLSDADFKDIFEVRGIKRTKRGRALPAKISEQEINFPYTGADDIIRKTRIHFYPQPDILSTEKIEYTLCLDPRECKDIFISIAMEEDDTRPEIIETDEAYFRMISNINRAKNLSPKIHTSNNQFNLWIKRALSDLFTLRTELPSGLYPYAGIPWYCTPFGRDGIITALQTLWVFPDIAKGVLKYLAKTQAKHSNDFQDADPGKIFHEQRDGEMANTGEIPFKMYYGSVDSTPLFIILASWYYDRTGDLELIKEIWPNIELAVEWIDKYGDLDGDGFIEYERKSESGLGNQGWKDSWDSIFHEDGTLADTPIALCEVQGYTYAAKIGAANFYEMFGNTKKAEVLRKQAKVLKENFAKAFWSEEKQTYVIALDKNKNQCHVRSSNAGICLFTGIATKEHAEKISRTLLSGRMFSGWGIRTIANNEQRYNPMSYHNGSVWPHDNAMIAEGFARYGLINEVTKVLSAMFDVSLHFEAQRLPELFCGFERLSNIGVTNYPVACSPQAWSAASIYMFLQAMLRIRIRAGEKIVYFYNPTLPDFIDELTISNLQVNNGKVALKIKRINGEIRVELLASHEPEVEIKILSNFSEIEKENTTSKIFVS